MQLVSANLLFRRCDYHYYLWLHIYVRCSSHDLDLIQVITGSLPGVASTSAAEIEDSTILAVGYLAGIQYRYHDTMHWFCV